MIWYPVRVYQESYILVHMTLKMLLRTLNDWSHILKPSKPKCQFTSPLSIGQSVYLLALQETSYLILSELWRSWLSSADWLCNAVTRTDDWRKTLTPGHGDHRNRLLASKGSQTLRVTPALTGTSNTGHYYFGRVLVSAGHQTWSVNSTCAV